MKKGINSRIDLEKLIGTYQYPNIFIKPINMQFASRYGEVNSHNIDRLLYSLNVRHDNNTQKFCVEDVYKLMTQNPDSIASAIISLGRTNPQTEDELEYNPNFDTSSVDKWYRPRQIHLTEEQYNRIFESVYVNNVKGNKAYLTYNTEKRKKNNLYGTDFLETDKMDVNNADTYEVTLKGGLKSYNITSIKGSEVMHYFKKLWDNNKTTIKIGDNDSYELDMLKDEFNKFKQQFLNKVGFVVEYCANKFKEENNISFDKISIYPVKSSSNFNVKMTQEIAAESIKGLSIKVVNSEILLKDLKTLSKDEEFISKNKEYYDSPMIKQSNMENDPLMQSLNKHIDKDLNKYKAISQIKNVINDLNKNVDDIIQIYYIINQYQKQGRNFDKHLQRLTQLYMNYYDCFCKIRQLTKYVDPLKNNELSSVHLDKVLKALQYSKGPSIEKRTSEIWQMVSPYLRGKKSIIDGSPYLNRNDIKPINKWVSTPFEIKNLTNGERMGLKNFYRPSDDTEMVQKEIEEIKNTILVIFDDNISGGATLSDICYQFKQLGIECIIPITFGKMDKKTTLNFKPLNQPINNKGEQDFNY